MDVYIYKNIKYLRQQNGITQKELAKALGKTVSAVSNYETFRAVPELLTVLKIAKYFNISLDDLCLKDIKSSFAASCKREDASLQEYFNNFKVLDTPLAKDVNLFDQTMEKMLCLLEVNDKIAHSFRMIGKITLVSAAEYFYQLGKKSKE